MNAKIVVGAALLMGVPVLVAQVTPNNDDVQRGLNGIQNMADDGGIAGGEPDVTVSRLGLNSSGSGDDLHYYGTVGGIRAYSAASTSCNAGTATAEWISGNSGKHPVIAQNLYRASSDGQRFEMIGMSWLKHSFCAVSEFTCGSCQSTGCSTLGVWCADTYWATLNGDHDGLGPRAQINPEAGATNGGATPTHTDPHPVPSGNGTIRGRLQVASTDITSDPGARFFLEVHYVTHDEIWENRHNNASWREVEFNGNTMDGTGVGQPSVQWQEIALTGWQDVNPKVNIVAVDEPGAGRFHVAYLVVDNQDGTYTYEYAVHNMNNHNGAGSFSVPVGENANILSNGFHDVDYHSGDGAAGTRDGTDWAFAEGSGTASWSTTPFATSSNANALLWSTAYNFRITTDTAPVAGQVELGLWRDGSGSVSADVMVPGAGDSDPCVGDLDGDGFVTTTDLLDFIGNWGSADSAYDIANDGGNAGSSDLLALLGAWGDCP